MVTGLTWKSIVVFLTSALPIVESKGAIMLARFWHMPFVLSCALCVAGSYIPVPVLLFRKPNDHLRLTKKLDTMPDSLKKYIERYGCLALLVLIAVPFTGLGCWLSALIARATHMNKRNAAVCIFIGNVIAIILMTGAIHGIVTGIEKMLGLI